MPAINEMDRFWSLPSNRLIALLKSTSNGLTSEEAEKRLQIWGANSLSEKKQATVIGIFLSQFKSPIILILLFATAISALVGDWTDALIILTIILVSGLLGFYQEYSASSAVEKLQAQVRVQASVLRDGESRIVATEAIVPGDVVLLSAGNLIPGDGVLLEARDLLVNQAMLTGETFPSEKKPGISSADSSLAERDNTVFMGTSVRSGSGRALIIQTGKHTAYGAIAGRLALRPPETEFERGIRRLGYLLSEVMFVLVIIVFAINVLLQKPVLDSLLFSIALAVGLTPQMLPAIINVNLARGSQKMAAQGVIVRRLNAIENFGSMDILCTDKTGTLTLGIVRLDGALDADGQPSDEVMRLAYDNAYLQKGMVNPLDEAIVTAAPSGIEVPSKVDEIPYDFVRKLLSVVVVEGDHHRMVTKGALEKVLEKCSSIAPTAEPLTEVKRAAIHERFSQWSEQGYRVLGVASRRFDPQSTYSRSDEHDLIFEGFLLFFDPPKPGVKQVITDLEALGVRLKVITGDNRLVAQHTAEVIGLPVKRLLTGREMADVSDAALLRLVEETDLFAEVDPNQKERIILAYQKMGHVVGYMGDGVNDAPPLHAADVGISVDTAVDVAKEAADFVLLKHDLSILRQGILQGRITFANTLKYVFMATSANFGNMFSVAGASLLLPFLPFLPKQILLINFLTDLPEMTIARDNVDEEFIQRPRRWDIAFIRRFMLTFGVLSSVFDYLTFGTLMILLNSDVEQFRTGWFIESMFSALMVIFALRTRLPFRHSHPSRAMLLVAACAALATLALAFLPLGSVIGFEPIGLEKLALMTVISVLYFGTAEFVKGWFYRRYDHA